MTELGKLTVRIDARDAILSFRSVLENLAALGGFFERVVDLTGDRAVSSDELGNLVRCEAVDFPASGASELHGLKLLPGDGYREIVSAIADQSNLNIFDSHGWPILSVGESPASV